MASADHAITRLSSKNQITLPVAMVRALGMKPGEEVDLSIIGDTIFLSRRPRTPQEWVAKFAGSMKVPGWDTPEAIDAYVREERDSWTRDGDDF
jgi:bifunctional DNA-binding transcriptional regulator/antitoxin component of YhaV-PrlF toxin-antitoxin module